MTNDSVRLNEISGQIVDAAIKVHSALGPGLLEGAYQACLTHEMRKRGFKVRSQVRVPVVYDDVRIDIGYRLDLLVEEAVIVELKAVSKVLPVHHAQVLSYLKLSNRRLGLLLNFHVSEMRNGIIRIVNRL